MWLRARRETNLLHHEPDDYASSWCVDVMGWADVSDPMGGAEAYPVGRILADELRRFEIGEWGEDIWSVADADSARFEAASASVLHEEGVFREDGFDGPADPVIYLYRFQLHEDFSDWRLAILDACCRAFGDGALILAHPHHVAFRGGVRPAGISATSEGKVCCTARIPKHRPRYNSANCPRTKSAGLRRRFWKSGEPAPHQTRGRTPWGAA